MMALKLAPSPWVETDRPRHAPAAASSPMKGSKAIARVCQKFLVRSFFAFRWRALRDPESAPVFQDLLQRTRFAEARARGDGVTPRCIAVSAT